MSAAHTAFLKYPRLPSGIVHTMLISGEFPAYAHALEQRDILVYRTIADDRLDLPVQFHPDMQFCDFGEGNMLALKGSALCESLFEDGFSVSETARTPQKSYPNDVLCNVLLVGEHAFGNPRSLDSRILEEIHQRNYQFHAVKQGYAACSACVVDKTSMITADMGIYKAGIRAELEVLLIAQGGILLKGYEMGFIGGCCGKIAFDEMVFTGRLCTHASGKEIRRFLESRNIRITELSDTPLVDIGGIIPLREKIL